MARWFAAREDWKTSRTCWPGAYWGTQQLAHHPRFFRSTPGLPCRPAGSARYKIWALICSVEILQFAHHHHHLQPSGRRWRYQSIPVSAFLFPGGVQAAEPTYSQWVVAVVISRIVGCLEMVNTRKHSNFNGEYYEYKFRGTLFSDNYIILYVFEKQLLVKHRNNLMNLRDYERIISTTCAQHHNLQLLETHRQTAFTWHRTCSGPSI